MININLLPWRAQLQKEKQREFIFLILVSLGISIFICLMVHLYLARQLSKQLDVNNYLLQEINVVDQKIIQVNSIKQQKNDLIRRLYIIHQLQTSRVELVEMFHNFVNILPASVYITSIKKHTNLITINGQARSNQEVSQLMKNIEASSSFSSAVLTEIQDNTDNTQTPPSAINEIYPLSFELQVKQESAPEVVEETNNPAKNPSETPGQGSVP